MKTEIKNVNYWLEFELYKNKCRTKQNKNKQFNKNENNNRTI